MQAESQVKFLWLVCQEGWYLLAYASFFLLQKFLVSHPKHAVHFLTIEVKTNTESVDTALSKSDLTFPISVRLHVEQTSGFRLARMR